MLTAFHRRVSNTEPWEVFSQLISVPFHNFIVIFFFKFRIFGSEVFLVKADENFNFYRVFFFLIRTIFLPFNFLFKLHKKI